MADPAGLAWSFHILVQRAIVADLEGDPQAAGHARTVVALLLEDHRPPTPHP